ncbi:hypothetical protein FBF83_10470 [Pseudalkalibacillus hwajinpoensis]|uniref:Uncharacterized protein n=1 Tax=Guptibacillus hwajinpoensis TaxID=208199 RepID=A0A4U1MKZ7_9BACL|nr:hypothetical protein FBF83_10470 [Pseudalkalibacillus hwajinpoensis]
MVAFQRFIYREPHIIADWSGRIINSCGTSGTGETPQARCSYAPKRLSARTKESEHPGAQINHHYYLLMSQSFNQRID